MIYSSIGPNPRFFAAMTNALASSGNSKNAHKSTVRRMVISNVGLVLFCVFARHRERVELIAVAVRQ